MPVKRLHSMKNSRHLVRHRFKGNAGRGEPDFCEEVGSEIGLNYFNSEHPFPFQKLFDIHRISVALYSRLIDKIWT